MFGHTGSDVIALGRGLRRKNARSYFSILYNMVFCSMSHTGWLAAQGADIVPSATVQELFVVW